MARLYRSSAFLLCLGSMLIGMATARPATERKPMRHVAVDVFPTANVQGLGIPGWPSGGDYFIQNYVEVMARSKRDKKKWAPKLVGGNIDELVDGVVNMHKRHPKAVLWGAEIIQNRKGRAVKVHSFSQTLSAKVMKKDWYKTSLGIWVLKSSGYPEKPIPDDDFRSIVKRSLHFYQTLATTETRGVTRGGKLPLSLDMQIAGKGSDGGYRHVLTIAIGQPQFGRQISDLKVLTKDPILKKMLSAIKKTVFGVFKKKKAGTTKPAQPKQG